MKKIRVGINGLGRIGRAFLKVALLRPEIEVVAINELGDIENMAYLLRYDSVYGRSNFQFSIINSQAEQFLVVEDKKVRYLSEKDPAKLPWKDLDIDVVVESTGFFASVEKSQAHIGAGAKRVVITAPLKEPSQTDADLTQTNAEGKTILMGVNESELATCKISSNASCTTNAASPLISILDEAIGVEKAVLNTVHAYTATQALVDSAAGNKGLREGRAAAANMIPSSTGAAVAVTKAFTKLDGLFDGISIRVPVLVGSIADVTFIAKRATSVEEVNKILRAAGKDPRWQGIFVATDEELVSSDIIGRPEGSIADLSMTRVVGGNLVKVLAWYDNEMGYAATLLSHVLKAGAYIS